MVRLSTIFSIFVFFAALMCGLPHNNAIITGTAYSEEQLIFPVLTARVVDDANVLSPSTRQQLDLTLSQLESRTTDQLVVVTLSSLQGKAIEDYGYQLGRKWGIGQKDKNNGVLLIVAPNEHKVRIEVGYGLEGTLTDAISSEIIRQDILPLFKAGHIESGIVAGTQRLVAVLGGDTMQAGSNTADMKSAQSHNSYGDPGAFFIFIIVIFFMFIRAFTLPMIGSSSSYYGGRGGFGSGFGGGGFSGGGGSFGGGGASGGW